MISITPSVMVVGYGFMGKNHVDKVERLAREGRAKLACIVDIDPIRIADLQMPAYLSVDQAFRETLPDIIAICTSTKTHEKLLHKIHILSNECKKVVHILVEKPLTANLTEGESVQNLYSQYKGRISSGYLFRQSPIIPKAVNYLKKHGLAITGISSVWQKNRVEKGPSRPSEGVHIDESTHPVDLIMNCILPKYGFQMGGVTILSSSFKRQSELGQIVDQKKQEELYWDDPSKLDPIAEVEYKIDVDGILFNGFASYVRGPQRREISFELADGTSLLLEFDLNIGDRLSKISPTQNECLWAGKVDKLMHEWESFLKYCETGEKTFEIQTFSEMLFDIRLTEALGKKHEEPILIPRMVEWLKV